MQRCVFHMVIWITIVKPIVWTLAFVPAYGLRAAGDVKIFYDHVVSGHVAVPILSVRDTDPISGIWTDGRLGRYVCRLDGACSNIYMEIP